MFVYQLVYIILISILTVKRLECQGQGFSKVAGHPFYRALRLQAGMKELAETGAFGRKMEKPWCQEG
jgi:hypothetical protein